MLETGTVRAPSVVFGEGHRPEASTRVAVAEFEGPLALLLALIEARELDVLTVPLGALADAYLDALATLDVDRLGNVSSFVAVASQLILIKSRAMLPRQAPAGPAGLADEAPDPEAELRARLLLYRAYRDAGDEPGGRGVAPSRPLPARARHGPRHRDGRVPGRPTRRRSRRCCWSARSTAWPASRRPPNCRRKPLRARSP